MRPSSFERLTFQRVLEDTRVGGRVIYACLPQVLKGTFDEDTQSGLDVSGGDDGTGRTVEWRVAALYANVRNVDQALRTFGAAPPGAEVGDTFLTIGLRDQELAQEVARNEHAYYDVDGDRFRPTGRSAAGVGGIEEWVITLSRYHPVWVAPGH